MLPVDVVPTASCFYLKLVWFLVVNSVGVGELLDKDQSTQGLPPKVTRADGLYLAAVLSGAEAPLQLPFHLDHYLH